ncbi:MAG: hypothetical protein V1843_01770 [bacterium]
MIQRIENINYRPIGSEKAVSGSSVRKPEKEFADYFVNELLRQAMPEAGMMGGVSGYEFNAYKDIFTQEIASMLSNDLGFANMVSESTGQFKARSQESKWR